MEAKINQLAPVEDFDKAYIIAQYAHEQGFRGTTFPELLSWMQTQLDLTGTDLIDPTPPGTETSPAVIPPGPEGKKGKFEPSPGFYQGFPEVTADKRWYFYWDSTSWSLVYMGKLGYVEFNGIIEDGNEEGVNGDKIYNKVAAPIGLEFHPPGYNIFEDLNPLDVSDTTVWRDGFYEANGTVSTGGWVNILIPLSKGVYRTNNYIAGLAAYVVFDSQMNVVHSYLDKGVVNGSVEWEIEMPSDGFLGISQGKNPDLNRHPFYLNATQETALPTGKIFLLKNEFGAQFLGKMTEEMEGTYGVQPIPEGINFVENLNVSDLTDENIWGRGFLREDGSIESGTNWYHTKEFIPISKGTYSYYFWFSGNARAVIYNRDFSIQQTISRGSGGDGFVGTFTVLRDSYLRFPHRQNIVTQPERLTSIYVTNTKRLQPTIITSENIRDYAKESTVSVRQVWKDMFRPKLKRPVVTLISDDLHERNAEWYIPLLDEYGVKSTFAVIGDRTVAADGGHANGYLPSSYVKKLYKDGHNIASHTWTHGHMNQMTLEEIDDELSRTKIYLEQFVDIPVNMFVSPFGERSPKIDNIVSKYYSANFISGFGSLNPPPIDRFFLNRMSFDSSEANPTLSWESRLKPSIDEAIRENNWLIFAIHPQYTQYRESNPIGLDRQNEMRILIEYCIANNIEILTADKAYNYWSNFVDIGVPRFDSRYYKLGMDGSEVNVSYFESE